MQSIGLEPQPSDPLMPPLECGSDHELPDPSGFLQPLMRVGDLVPWWYLILSKWPLRSYARLLLLVVEKLNRLRCLIRKATQDLLRDLAGRGDELR